MKIVTKMDCSKHKPKECHGNQLTSLVLRRISGPMPAAVLKRAIRMLGGLRTLVLRDVRRLKSAVFFRQLGLRLPHLTVLDVGHCPYFGTAALGAVAYSGLSLRAYREHGHWSTLPHASDVDFIRFCHHMKDTITVIKINATPLQEDASISQDYSLWRSLKIIGDLQLQENEGESTINTEKSSRAKAKWLIDKAFPHMRELVIEDRSDASQLLSYASCHGNQLTSLVLRRISGPMPAAVLKRAIRMLGGLRTLVLRDVRRLKSAVFFEI